jgi:hypothetical protein
MGAIRLSTLLIVLGLLLTLTTRSSSQWRKYLRGINRTPSQIYQDFRSGKEPRMSLYAHVVTLVSVVLIIAATYLLFVGR